MYYLYRVSNLAVWLQQINKLYLLNGHLWLYHMPVHARFCWYLDFENLTSILSWTRNLLTLTQTETERTTSLEQMSAGDPFTERMKWKELMW